MAHRVLAALVVGASAVLFLGALALSGFNGDTATVLPGAGVVGFAVVGALIIIRRPENPVGPLLAATGLGITLLGAAEEYARRALVTAPGSLPGGRAAAYVMMWLPLISVGLLVTVLPQVFPNGRALSPRWRPGLWAAWGYIVAGALANALDREAVNGLGGYPNPYPLAAVDPYLAPLFVLSGVCLVTAVLTGVVVIVVRWRRSAGDERQQLKWFIAGVAPLLVPLVLHEVSPALSGIAFALLLPLVPAAFGVAILRYRLYDLDVVLNRAIVYTVLSALVAGFYLALVTVSDLVIGEDRARWLQVLSTVAAAAIFQPARTRVQRAVDRLFYGDRSRPYEVLSRLGMTLERTSAPQEILPGVAESIARTLRLPYAAVELREGDGWVVAAAHGNPAAERDEFAMVYQEDTIGRLVVGRRHAQAFSHIDRRLLSDLARQAGVAAHAVRLNLALQRSRAALVTAREEERRRLRRDLHDGLGPALAGVTLGLHGAAVNVTRDPAAAVEQLHSLQGQVEAAVRDIRRLVYGLRPPALDELGLALAIRREAARIEGEEFAVTVEVGPDGLGTLPAAVEAAAYWIVIEALTNVSRHAAARTCRVRLVRGRDLDLAVSDDGRGCGGRPAGVGLAAMRERAAELGGSCRIEQLSPGTRVVARLPIAETAETAGSLP